jgi:hypothetical protein
VIDEEELYPRGDRGKDEREKVRKGDREGGRRRRKGAYQKKVRKEKYVYRLKKQRKV